MPGSPTSATSSAEYDESLALVEDLQRLLADAELSDASALTADGERVALHTSLLGARCTFFEVAMRKPWHRPPAPIKLPYTSRVLADVLEFLATGCVRLTCAAHAVRVGRAAHAVGCEELTEVCATHIRDTSNESLDEVMKAAHEPLPTDALPDMLHDTFVEIAVERPAEIIRADAHAGVLLLATAHVQGVMTPIQRTAAVRALARVAPVLHMMLRECSVSEAGAIRSLLLAAPARLFSRVVERHEFLSSQDVIEKYRQDAIERYDLRVPVVIDQWMCAESAHPHTSHARYKLRYVRVVGAVALSLHFHKHSILAQNALLQIFRHDPRTSDLPPFMEIRRSPPSTVTIPSGECWLVFHSGKHIEWGWRLEAHAVPLDVVVRNQNDTD